MRRKILIAFMLCALTMGLGAKAQIINAYGRNSISLNGEWHAIVDPFDRGKSMGVYKNHKPERKNEFREYSFDEGLILNVPGDFNSQNQELKYYEGPVWYGRYFDMPDRKGDESQFLYFAGVSNIADVYLNGEQIGHHEGAFTPFQIDVTDKLKDSDNFLAVATDNRRSVSSIPAMNFDWWNYGGITRDVMLINVPKRHIADYFVRLDKGNTDLILVDANISAPLAGEEIWFEIPELGIKEKLVTDSEGKVSGQYKAKKLTRWDTDNPKLYDVVFSTDRDTIADQIGFRTIKTDGCAILLNDRPIFLSGVNIHEEIPQRKGRAFSEADAMMILGEAKALGTNFIRLAHYPQNEHIVKMAEKMGFLLWEEIPVWQNIDFANPETEKKGVEMIREMIGRDKNRAAIVIWSIANETHPSEARNKFLANLRDAVAELDDTRLIGAAFNNPYYDKDSKCYRIKGDPCVDMLDVVGVNKYIGWYEDWQVDPSETAWNVAKDKPLIMSEFGCEALFGRHGDDDVKSSWSEDYQARVYRDNLEMFKNIPNLAGTSPWVLFDFRSPTRMSPQQGLEFNRKGLVSDRGERKKAWYIMRDYYNGKNVNKRKP